MIFSELPPLCRMSVFGQKQSIRHWSFVLIRCQCAKFLGIFQMLLQLICLCICKSYGIRQTRLASCMASKSNQTVRGLCTPMEIRYNI